MRAFALGVCVVAFATPLASCGTLAQFTNPAISSDHLDETPPELNKLKLVSGDRRLMRIVAQPKPRDQQPANGKGIEFYDYLVCAETHADAISARSSTGNLAIRGQTVSDTNVEALTKTVERSAVSDVVRQLGWQLCNARLNGDLSGAEYGAALEDMRARAFNALAGKQTEMPAPK